MSTLIDHIDELRKRFIYCAIAIVLGFGVAFFFVEQVLKLIILPAHGVNFIYIDVTEMFSVYMQVCLAISLAVVFPVLLYQIIRFVAPALSSAEKKLLWVMLPCVAIFFVGGVIFGYYVLIPPSIQFLTSFGEGIATPQLRIGNYVSLISLLLFSIGLIFEIPVVAVLLTKIGIVSSRWLRQQWKWAIVGAAIIGAVVTPTWDPFNQALVAIPVFVLYLLSIFFSFIVESINRKRKMEGIQ
jgi:sec-independent protein translocase protein TatC